MVAVAVHGAPAWHTTFVGRRDEVAAVVASLVPGRVVTLVGPGGAGKSRLAAAAAAKLASEWPEGAWWVDLSGRPAAGHVRRRMVEALRPLLPTGPQTTTALASALADRRLVLVVDNCEHVLEDAAETIATLVATSDGIAVLATSQAPLAVTAEGVLRVPPMTLADGVELFLQRAQFQGDGGASGEVRHAARRVCDRLDRLPLALELAAGWSGVLNATQIADALAQPLDLLDGGPRDAPFRQRSLEASLAWSHGLLDTDQRVLFRRLAVFRPGFTAEAVSEVCGFGELSDRQVLRALRGLVETSLVVVDGTGAQARYSMLGVVHGFAEARLADSPDCAEARGRHFRAYQGLVERARPLLDSDKDAWRATLVPDYANLRAAVEWGLSQPDASAGRRLAADLAWLWHIEGLDDEGLPILRRAAECGRSEQSLIQARVLLGLAIVADPTTSREEGYVAAREAARIAAPAEDWETVLVAQGLVAIGLIGEDLDAARDLAEKVVREARVHGQAFAEDAGQLVTGLLHLIREEFAAAISALEKAIPRLLARGDRGVASTGLGFLALAQARAGSISQASETAHLAMVTAEPLNDVHRRGSALRTLAEIERLRGDLEEAGRRLEELARLVEASGRSVFVPGWEWAAARVALCQGDPVTAMSWCRGEAAVLGGGEDDAALTPDTMVVLATAMVAAGQAPEAQVLLQRIEDLARAMALPGKLAAVAELRATLAEDSESALSLHYDALRIRAEHLLVPDCIDSLEAVAPLLYERGQHETAAVLAGAARAARAEAGYHGRSPVTDRRAAVDNVLADPALVAAEEHGRTLTVWEAAGLALRRRGPRQRPSSGLASLTPTERAVVDLAATGLTNPEIASRLFVSRGTVKTHLEHVYAKLGITNRTQLAGVVSGRVSA